MNLMSRVLVTAAFVAGTASAVRADVATAEVSYQIYDFYNPSQPLNDYTMRVSAHNNATGENFTSDRDGTSFTLPVGNYTFSGRGQWCYLQQKTIEITVDTSDITLLAGCE
jgi:hypothetical protein